MREFLERHALSCLVVALAVLLAAVIMALSLAYNALGWFEFFIVWLAVSAVGGILLIVIVDFYEVIEIGKFQKTRNSLRKEDDPKKDGGHAPDDS